MPDQWYGEYFCYSSSAPRRGHHSFRVLRTLGGSKRPPQEAKAGFEGAAGGGGRMMPCFSKTTSFILN